MMGKVVAGNQQAAAYVVLITDSYGVFQRFWRQIHPQLKTLLLPCSWDVSTDIDLILRLMSSYKHFRKCITRLCSDWGFKIQHHSCLFVPILPVHTSLRIVSSISKSLSFSFSRIQVRWSSFVSAKQVENPISWCLHKNDSRNTINAQIGQLWI